MSSAYACTSTRESNHAVLPAAPSNASYNEEVGLFSREVPLPLSFSSANSNPFCSSLERMVKAWMTCQNLQEVTASTVCVHFPNHFPRYVKGTRDEIETSCVARTRRNVGDACFSTDEIGSSAPSSFRQQCVNKINSDCPAKANNAS